MKMFIALVMFVSVQSFAFAEGVTAIEEGDVSISQARAEITSIKPICPAIPGRPTCMAYGSKVTIKVELLGCVDRLGGYVSKFEIVDGKGFLHFTALNVFNEASRRARCVAAPFKTVTLYVPYQNGEIELVDMEFVGNILPQH